MPRKVNQNSENVKENSLKETETQYNNSHSETKKRGNDKEKLLIDKAQQREEKQRLKNEEKLKKEHEKKQRDEEKKRKDLERETERKKKELEKEEEKKKREFERKQKELEREEEKRKKELEKKQKDVEREEERRRKEEEKRKKEDEKRKEEEERNKKLEKQRAILMGFFNKDKIDQDLLEQKSSELQHVGGFKPIEIKKDMKMAPINRTGDCKSIFQSYSDLIKENPGINSHTTYLDELLSGVSGNGISPETWPLPEPDILTVTCKRLKAKSFMFVENIRPPYYGTWRKRSELITPLNPLAEDRSFFDYDIDSDQEWEYESGEDIGSTDNEEDDGADNEEELEDISFLVPHGYLSEGEDIIDADCDDDDDDGGTLGTTVTKGKRKQQSLSDETKKMMVSIREKQFQAEVKQQVHQINPSITGPHFVPNRKHVDNAITTSTTNNGADQLLYRMICRTVDGFPVTCNLQSDMSYCSSNGAGNHGNGYGFISGCGLTSTGVGGGSSKMKNVPPEAVVHIIRLVHCNQLSRAKLCYEFRMYWEYSLTNRVPDVTFESDLKGRDWDEFSIGKKRFFEKLKEIADWKEGMWIVKPEVIQEYQLCCIDEDPNKPCTEKWKYVSNIQNFDPPKKASKSATIMSTKKRKASIAANPVEGGAPSEKLMKHDTDTEPLVEKCP